jgi:hypothetical protein
MSSDLKNFRGIGAEDFLEEHERAQENGPANTAYQGWGELLNLWYAWCEERDLEPVDDFREQTRLYVDAEKEAERRAARTVYKDLTNADLKKRSQDERDKLAWDYHYEVQRQTREVLGERGFITLFDQFTVTVNPDTLEVEQQDFFKRPAQRNVPIYARALYRLPEGSSLTWRDFYDYYVKLLERDETLPDHAGVQAAGMEIRPRTPEHIWALSMMPAQTVDRAARGKRGWAFPIDDAPTFQDANNKHAVTYFADGVTLEALREGVMQLNPRTADVWRLATAAILEAWGRGEKEPPRVWLDARQLCDAMGFKKHHKGGHRPENVAIAARALVDLERFHITIPYGAKQYPEGTNGKRKQTTIQARARHRVLAIMAKEEAKQLFDDEYLPLRWLVTAGEWIKAYPREQFAPLFRALVELPGTYTPDLWAKALGTELVWQYRQDEGKVQVQRVETMLRQACVLDEARAEKNKGRARDNFEKAMDALQKYGVCTGWEYNGADIDQVEAKQKGWFDLWLQARVTVTPPAEVTKALERVAKTKKQYRKRAKKA